MVQGIKKLYIVHMSGIILSLKLYINSNINDNNKNIVCESFFSKSVQKIKESGTYTN